jgi:Tfp pilus assembly protein FimT
MRAFTLTEIIIVISILIFCASVGLPECITTLTRTFTHIDKFLLLSAIREARAESMHHTCRSQNCAGSASHGLYIEQNKITLFEGSSYIKRNTDTDIIVPFLSEEQISNSNQVVFTYSGNPTNSTTLSMTGKDNRTETIQIFLHGGISSNT